MNAKGTDAAVVQVRLINVEKLSVSVQRLPEVESPNVDHLVNWYATELCFDYRSVHVYSFDLCLQDIKLFPRYKVCLVEDENICKGDLLVCLILDSLRLDLIKMLAGKLGVNECDDRVESAKLFYFFIDEEGLSNRGWVSKTCSLYDDVRKLPCMLFDELLDGNDDITAHRAADTTIHHLNNLVLGLEHKRVIDAHISEFVLDDGKFVAMLLLEQVVQKCCLS